jgi:hypothetical protein
MLPDEVSQALDAAFFQDARRRHGKDAWASAVRAGAALSFHNAIAAALDEPAISAAPA